MSGPTGGHGIGGLATLVALSLALGFLFPLTLAGAVATGLCAGAVVFFLSGRSIGNEFALAVVVPLFGLLIVLTVLAGVYEYAGLTFQPTAVAFGAAIGLAAATVSTLWLPLTLDRVSGVLVRRSLGISGQLLIPLVGATTLVYVLDQLRILALFPPPDALLAAAVLFPERSLITALLVTPLLAGLIFGLIGFLLARPLQYGLLAADENEGRAVALLSVVFYRLAIGIAGSGWLLAFVLMVAELPEITLPEVIAGWIETVGTLAQDPVLVASLLSGVGTATAITVLSSPILLFRLAGRTGTRQFVRYLFPGALAIIIGLSATFGVRQLVLQSPDGIQQLHEFGEPAWQMFNLAAVILTALPLVGALIIFTASVLAVSLLRVQDRNAVSQAFQTTLLVSLFVLASLSGAAGTPLPVVLGAAVASVLAWDGFEYGQTVSAELPAVRGVSATDLVHTAGIASVALGAAALALSLQRISELVATMYDSNLAAAVIILVGAVFLLFAIRE